MENFKSMDVRMCVYVKRRDSFSSFHRKALGYQDLIILIIYLIHIYAATFSLTLILSSFLTVMECRASVGNVDYDRVGSSSC